MMTNRLRRKSYSQWLIKDSEWEDLLEEAVELGSRVAGECLGSGSVGDTFAGIDLLPGLCILFEGLNGDLPA